MRISALALSLLLILLTGCPEADLTPYKNDQMQIRIGFTIASGGVYTVSSWNLDNVYVCDPLEMPISDNPPGSGTGGGGGGE